MNSMKKVVSILVSAAIMLSLIPAVQAADELPDIRNLAEGLSYEWSEEPEADYPDPGNKLTDGQYGSLNVLDPAWVGHLRKKTREVVFDLGEKKSISSVKAHFLQDWPTSSVLFPLNVSMYVSDDKENWGTLRHQSTEHLWVDGPPVGQFYVWDGTRDGVPSGGEDDSMAYARYVKVTFSMHTRAWSFLDEIEIWGTDGKVEGAVEVPAQQFTYLKPGEATAGIHDLSLVYNGYYANGDGDWTKEQLIPQISYVNEQGEPEDWFFDGVLLLGLKTPDWRDFALGDTRLTDWNWYLEKTFAEQGELYQLNEATKEVGGKLDQPDHATKVVLMIPDPGEYLTDFGDVDGDGISENFNAGEVGLEQAMANRKKAVRWWIDEVMQLWEEKAYSNLELAGLYWLHEQVSTSDTGPEMLSYVNGLVHEQDLKAFWIPHFLAYKSHMWKDVGFDAAAFQPNYFFEEMDAARIEDAAYIARQYGMGVEFEFDGRLLTEGGVFRDRYLSYLDGGVKYGYMDNAFKAYYKGSGPVLKNAAESKDPQIRVLYDWLYQFVKGTYKLDKAPDIAASMNGSPFEEGEVVGDSESVSFTWEAKDNGNGISSVAAVFNGEAYAKGSAIDLAGQPGEHELVITVIDKLGGETAKSYKIIVTTSPQDMKRIMERLEADGEFSNRGAVRSLTARLDSVIRFEEKGELEKAVEHMNGFAQLLESHKQNGHVSDKAYGILSSDAEVLLAEWRSN